MAFLWFLQGEKWQRLTDVLHRQVTRMASLEGADSTECKIRNWESSESAELLVVSTSMLKTDKQKRIS